MSIFNKIIIIKNIKISLISILFIIISAIGCSSFQNSKKASNDNLLKNIQVQGVALDQEKVKYQKPFINKTVIDQNDNILAYGPLTPARFDKSGNNLNYSRLREPIIGLILGPGIYRSIGQIEILKIFEKNNIPIHIISGTEMGLVIAALYAKYKSPSLVEWKIFKFLQKLPNKLKTFSPAWNKLFLQIILKEFVNNRIESYQLSLKVPVYNRMRKKLEYFHKGPIYTMLLSIFDLVKSNQKSTYSSAMLYKVFHEKALRKMGADIIISIDVNGSQVKFQNGDNFLMGTYNSLLGRIEGERKKLDVIFDLNLSDFYLDSLDDIPAIIQVCEDKEYDIVLMLREKIQAWRSKNSR